MELKFSTTCKTAWAKVTITRLAVYNNEADARIVRKTDGKAYTCGSAGGNGVVNKGQTSCYTPMVYDLDPRKAQAQGNMLYQIVMLIIMPRLFGIDEDMEIVR